MQSSCREVLRCLLEGIQWLKASASIDMADKLRHLAGANEGGMGAVATTARRDREADSSGGDEGRMVSEMASGEYGREHAGCRRREEQWRSFRPARSEPGRECVPANPLRVASGETAPMCCSAVEWRTMPPARSHWQKPYCPVSAKACCAWRTAAFSGSGCGSRQR